MDTPSWEQMLIEAFPNLSEEDDFEIVAQPSTQYNCIAYAAGDTSNWWEPSERRYWPDYATRSYSIESLIEVFAGLGFQRCQDSSLESDYEKVALYEGQGDFEHAAVQMPNGRWRSKMGQGPVIEHRSPESLSGGMYGNPTTHMRKVVSE